MHRSVAKQCGAVSYVQDRYKVKKNIECVMMYVLKKKVTKHYG